MKAINKHIVEYYQAKKFLGSVTIDGIVSDNEVGYTNQTLQTEGTIQLKKKYTATKENPLKLIKYNMQGR
jgi:hypothetical protein